MDEFFHKTTQLLWDYKTLWEEFDKQFLNEISTVGADKCLVFFGPIDKVCYNSSFIFPGFNLVLVFCSFFDSNS